MIDQKTIDILWTYVDKYNQVDFIENDPISIPYRYKNPRDIEIAAFFTAIISWGQRKTIIKNANALMEIFDDRPFEFVKFASHEELNMASKFVHRTFNGEDLLFLIERLRILLADSPNLESLFFAENTSPQNDPNAVQHGLERFYSLIFAENATHRTKKHVSTPTKKSACKKLNMFLRWMVRNDGIVDFGIWQNIHPSKLKIPLDTHVIRISNMLEITPSLKSNWLDCELLTAQLAEIHPDDPVIFDYALFGMGVDLK